jgi:hypothetical protein
VSAQLSNLLPFTFTTNLASASRLISFTASTPPLSSTALYSLVTLRQTPKIGGCAAPHSPILSRCQALAAEVDVKADSKGKEAFRRPLRVTRHTFGQHLSCWQYPQCTIPLWCPLCDAGRLKVVSAWCLCLADAVLRHDGQGSHSSALCLTSLRSRSR